MILLKKLKIFQEGLQRKDTKRAKAKELVKLSYTNKFKILRDTENFKVEKK